VALSCAAVRTLIVSDLHLGLRGGVDVLRRPDPLARLLQALDGVDRLVLLGDAFELLAWNSRPAAPVAEQTLRAIGRALGPDRTVVVVPGNHDSRLVHSWALARGDALGIADDVPLTATPDLSTLASWLAPAQVRCSYPGFWVSDRIWATHGHYLDRHLIPETAFGLWRSAITRRLGRRAVPGGTGGAAIEYERARRASAVRRRRGAGRRRFAARLRDRPLATVLETAAAMTRTRAMPQLLHLMMRANLAPIAARLVDAQMRGAAMPAMAEVAQRLGVDADWIVFGHVHRLGPRREPAWQPVPGGPRLLNTGAWMFEPMLLDRVQPPNPYWPGGAVIVEPGAEPRAVGLLDDLTREQLTGTAPSGPSSGSAVAIARAGRDEDDLPPGAQRRQPPRSNAAAVV
jgi:UDP-2,3-diacylglucosamine pyrophosphatase LpxH